MSKAPLLVGSCRHHAGMEPICGAGVNVRQLVGGPDIGWLRRLPCVSPANPLRDPNPVACPQHSPLSEAEADAIIDDILANGTAIGCTSGGREPWDEP